VVSVVAGVGAVAVAVALPQHGGATRPSSAGAGSAAASASNAVGSSGPSSSLGGTTSTGVGDVVPWVDRPAASPPPSVPDSPPAPPAPPPLAAPACSAAQLRATSGGSGGAAGNDVSVVVLRNVGANDCSLSGYPTSLALVDTAGVQHAMTPQHGTMFDAEYSWPVDVHPGETASVGVTFSAGCAAAQQPDAQRPQYTSAVLGMPGGGTVSAPVDVVAACGIGVTQLGRPQPQPSPPASPFAGLTADIRAPDTVVGGSTLDYTVTLTNGSDHTIALDPCPTYQQFLYVATAPPVPRAEPEFFTLNCDTVHAVAAGQSVTYAMRIRVPAVSATTSLTKFLWLMPDGMGVAAFRALTVTDGTA
jgi:hypothetical protein